DRLMFSIHNTPRGTYCRGGPPWPPSVGTRNSRNDDVGIANPILNRGRPRRAAPTVRSEVSFGYCHLKIFSAITKLTTHHVSSIAIGTQLDDSDASSFINARRMLLSAVNGSAWMNGCSACGNRSDEKNVPDSNHIGSMMKFINPDTPSMVVGRAATSNPIPENVKPPSPVINATLNHEPRTVKPKARVAKMSTAATSSTRNTRRES